MKKIGIVVLAAIMVFNAIGTSYAYCCPPPPPPPPPRPYNYYECRRDTNRDSLIFLGAITVLPLLFNAFSQPKKETVIVQQPAPTVIVQQPTVVYETEKNANKIIVNKNNNVEKFNYSNGTMIEKVIEDIYYSDNTVKTTIIITTIYPNGKTDVKKEIFYR